MVEQGDSEMMCEDELLSNLSESDLSRLQNCEGKVNAFFSRDDLAREEERQNLIRRLSQLSVDLLDKAFTVKDLKEGVLPNLKGLEAVQDTDLMWRINVFLHKKSCKK